eukprot:1393383-Karenia_brevis.AAC.1
MHYDDYHDDNDGNCDDAGDCDYHDDGNGDACQTYDKTILLLAVQKLILKSLSGTAGASKYMIVDTFALDVINENGEDDGDDA